MTESEIRPLKQTSIFSFWKPTTNLGSTNIAAAVDIEEIVEIEDDNDQPPPKIQRVEPKEVEATSSFERDPGLRAQIFEYPVNQRDEVRRAYINMGPFRHFQPVYPPTPNGDQMRRFQNRWFTQFWWLEYSPATDSAYCFPCFIFEKNPPKYPTFTIEGFRSWKRVNDGSRCALLNHMGGPNSMHMNAVGRYEDLKKASHHIENVLMTHSNEEIIKNRLRLKMTIDCLLWLALQGCAFRGHDESIGSENRGNFLELLKFTSRYNDKVYEVVLQNAPKNATYTSPEIQKEILHILGERVRRRIREEVGDSKFCILVDEARDSAIKEQMAIVLRFVDSGGFVQERFFKVVGVDNTNASTLKKGICDVLKHYNLQVENMRGQGYDGASNMRGAWNGLQALFLHECPYAYYVHCFAHRLQLALVASSKEEPEVWLFFSKLNLIVNLVVASSKRQSELQSAHIEEIEELLALGELHSGSGANQLGTLQRPGSTRWSSHYASVTRLIEMFGSTLVVLKSINENGSSSSMRGEAKGAFKAAKSFKFAFVLHLVRETMGITNVLCKALQRESQDIVNALSLVATTKTLLLELRNSGWETFLKIVVAFCQRHEIIVPDMNENYKKGTERQQQDVRPSKGKKQREEEIFTVGQNYRISIFTRFIDYQVMELSTRFSDEAMELLILSSALDPRGNYKSFDIDNICNLAAKFYPQDFDKQELDLLRRQLQHYKIDVLLNKDFQAMSTISELLQGLVETRKSDVFHLVDRLIRLVLTLPVSTATTERAFSAMKILKSQLRSKMHDEPLADCMAIYIEKEFSRNIDLESVVDEFAAIQNRRSKFH